MLKNNQLRIVENPVIPTKQKSDLPKQITFFISNGAKPCLGEHGKQKKEGGASFHFYIFSEGYQDSLNPVIPTI